jgi:hypothetical protein
MKHRNNVKLSDSVNLVYTNYLLTNKSWKNKSKKQNNSNIFVREEILATLKQGGNYAHASAEKLRFEALM